MVNAGVREELNRLEGSSFKLMVNPRLNNFYFWHFHPEYELVFIDGCDGNRHIGEHISAYEGSDLAFIGSFIPHLNFDYGVKTDYRKMVIHLSPDFIRKELGQMPELHSVRQLMERSKFGIVFGEATKAALKSEVFGLDSLPPFERFLSVLRILKKLSETSDYVLLHDKAIKNPLGYKEHKRLQDVFDFIDTAFRRKIELEEVADVCNLSKAAFCRYFKKMTKLTFIDFLNNYRIDNAKRLLTSGESISNACFDSGFESLSYFNRTFKKITGNTPLEFKKGSRTG